MRRPKVRNGKRVLLSARAQNAVSPRRHQDAQASMLINSMVIRYDAMVKENYRVIEIKFDPDERHELVHQVGLYLDCPNISARSPLWLFDSGEDLQQFCRIMRTAVKNQTLRYLSPGGAENLIDVLERRTSTTEFLTLCDWISVQLASSSKLPLSHAANTPR